MSTRSASIVLTALVVSTVTACSPGVPSSGSFVATLGPTDTVAVEHYTRSGNQLRGVSVTAYPMATVRSYDVTFAPSGEIASIHLATSRPGQDTISTADFTYTADSVTVDAHRDTLSRHFAVATDSTHPVPFYEDLFAFWELALRHEMAGTADTATFNTTTGRSLLPISFQRQNDSVADFGFPDWGTGHATFGPNGRLDQVDLTGTTSKYTVERVDTVDVQATATAWAARPAPGVLSPRDTASAQVGAAHVMIDYGRPSMRGRKVFGGIVPFDQVWRLGANEATQLITDRDLTIGDTKVPAGTYSLWAVPGQNSWTLIVNSQHGQWGTDYDAAQDFARIPMTVSPLPSPVEQFRISIEPSGSNGGTISMAWESTQATVSFKVQ